MVRLKAISGQAEIWLWRLSPQSFLPVWIRLTCWWGIFKEAGKCRRIPAIPDAVLGQRPLAFVGSWLARTRAVCYARWLDRNQTIADSDEIVAALQETFAGEPWVAGKNILERLTSTMEMVNRIERSGAGNQAL